MIKIEEGFPGTERRTSLKQSKIVHGGHREPGIGIK